jgi:hypothetical protein
MMKKKWLPHIIAAVSLAVFVVLGLASDGGASTPSSYSSDGGGGSYSDSSQQEGQWIVLVRGKTPARTSWGEETYENQSMTYTVRADSEGAAEAEGRRRFISAYPNAYDIIVSATRAW